MNLGGGANIHWLALAPQHIQSGDRLRDLNHITGNVSYASLRKMGKEGAMREPPRFPSRAELSHDHQSTQLQLTGQPTVEGSESGRE